MIKDVKFRKEGDCYFMGKKLSEYRPQAKNANKHNEIGLGMLEESIQGDGWIGAITVTADGETIAGSARLEKAAEIFGVEVEPIVIETDGKKPVVVVRKDIPSAEDVRAKRLAVADNRIAEVDLVWDEEVLKELREEMLEADGKITDKMMRELFRDEITRERKEERNIPTEYEETWKVEAGQVWGLGKHRVICGDCTDEKVLEKLLGKVIPDCMVTDPPYAVGIEYSEIRELVRKFTPLIEKYQPCVITCGTRMIWDYPRADGVGTWFVASSTSTGKWGFQCHNPLLYYGQDPYLKLRLGPHPNSLPLCAYREDNTYGHPTPKPLKVMEWLVERLTPFSGMTVLDPFLGSGTTLLACENLGRICYGVEISPFYLDGCLTRWMDFTGIEPVLLEE